VYKQPAVILRSEATKDPIDRVPGGVLRACGPQDDSNVETIEVRTADGQTLFADVREPLGEARGIAVLAHAMFARRTTFTRPADGSLAELFARSGYRTIAFDFRGHGDSAPNARAGGSWSYDDLVRADLPAVAGCARARWSHLPLVVVGHSLGGNVALAAQGVGVLGADALVLVATNMWTRGHEPSLRKWIAKRAIMETIDRVCRRRGYLPARALRIGSDDEPARYLAALTRCVRHGRWTSDDGEDDYAALTSRIRIPVAAVASDGDRLFCTPSCAARMIERVRGPKLLERVARADDGSAPPGHMGIVTSARVRDVYRRVVAWLRRELPRVAEAGEHDLAR
jgi:predicted alpha/beta hydrolase